MKRLIRSLAFAEGVVALATRPRGRRDGKVERRVVVGRADYVLASMSAGLSCVTRRQVARSGDGGGEEQLL